MDLSLGALNVLVGPNMAGKSNILDVLGLLYEFCFPQSGTSGMHYALAQRGGINEVLWKGGDDKLIAIALEATDEAHPGAEFRYELELIAGAGDFVATQKESLKFFPSGQRGALGAIPVNLTAPQAGGGLQLKNADGSNAGIVGLGGSALQYAQPNWDGYRLQQWIKLWRFYHLVPLSMKQPSPVPLGQVLMQTGENISAWLLWLQTHSPESFGRLTEVLKDLFPDVARIRTIPTPDGKVHMAVDEKGLRRPTNVWQTSDGFLMLTALLSLIYVPPELSGTLFCIEEPENHLHPRVLETLVRLLRQVRQEVADAKGSLSQILLTTQSPYLVDQFSIDEVIWVEKSNGQTKAYRPAGKSHLKKLVEDREIGLGDLMYTGALSEDK